MQQTQRKTIQTYRQSDSGPECRGLQRRMLGKNYQDDTESSRECPSSATAAASKSEDEMRDRVNDRKAADVEAQQKRSGFNL